MKKLQIILDIKNLILQVIFTYSDSYLLTLQCHELLYTFLAEILYIFNKISNFYQSTNLVKLHVSSRSSEILHFDVFLLSKSYKVLAIKEQKSYLSWHWRVSKYESENIKMTWRIRLFIFCMICNFFKCHGFTVLSISII